MIAPWPTYPRDKSGEIPKPLCFDHLTVRAEHGGAYLWDMNGVSIGVGSVTNDADDPMDRLFQRWQYEYESKPLADNSYPKWNSEQERIDFDEAGRQLAAKLHEHLNGEKTVTYCATDGSEWRSTGAKTPPALRRGSRVQPANGDSAHSEPS